MNPGGGVLPYMSYIGMCRGGGGGTPIYELYRYVPRGGTPIYELYRYVPRGGGVLPYMSYIGMCRCEGYGFQRI